MVVVVILVVPVHPPPLAHQALGYLLLIFEEKQKLEVIIGM